MAEKPISALKITEIAGKIVSLLEPLKSEDRRKVINGSLTLLGESTKADAADSETSTGSTGATKGQEHVSNLPGATKAQRWLKQNGLTSAQIEQIFDITTTGATVIASEVPGKGKREKTHSAYVLQGLAGFLASGEANFTDKDARKLCENLGCYDSPNHAKFIGEKGNIMTGSKENGWKLTAPGFKRGAEIVQQLTNKE